MLEENNEQSEKKRDIFYKANMAKLKSNHYHPHHREQHRWKKGSFLMNPSSLGPSTVIEIRGTQTYFHQK